MQISIKNRKNRKKWSFFVKIVIFSINSNGKAQSQWKNSIPMEKHHFWCQKSGKNRSKYIKIINLQSFQWKNSNSNGKLSIFNSFIRFWSQKAIKNVKKTITFDGQKNRSSRSKSIPMETTHFVNFDVLFAEVEFGTQRKKSRPSIQSFYSLFWRHWVPKPKTSKIDVFDTLIRALYTKSCPKTV